MARAVVSVNAQGEIDLADWPLRPEGLFVGSAKDVDGNGCPLSGLFTRLFSVGSSVALELWLAKPAPVVYGGCGARVAQTN